MFFYTIWIAHTNLNMVLFRKRMQRYCFFMKKHSQIVQIYSQIVQICIFYKKTAPQKECSGKMRAFLQPLKPDGHKAFVNNISVFCRIDIFVIV